MFTYNHAIFLLDYGVDLFFDIPQHPKPIKYVYAAHTAPIKLKYHFASSDVTCECDYVSTLTAYLDKVGVLITYNLYLNYGILDKYSIFKT